VSSSPRPLFGSRAAGRWTSLGAVVVVVLAALVGLRDFVSGARSPFFADIRYTHHPLITAGARRDGGWPLWSDHIFNGYPIFADPQAAQYYPPTWLVQGWGEAEAFTAFILLHLIIAGVGMLLWLRGRGLGTAAQLFGALTFALSGAFLNTAIHLGLFATVAWAPLWLASVEHVLRRPSAGAASLAGLVLAASILAGGPQFLVASVLLTGFFVAGVMIEGRARGSMRALAGRALSLVVVVLLGACVSAVALLPQLEFIPRSQRSIGLELAFAGHPSLAPHALWRLWLGPSLPRPGGGVEADAVELYIGALGLLLAFAGLITALRREHRREHGAVAASLGLFVLLALSASLGPELPVFRRLVEWVPGFGYFRAPSRLTCIAGVAIAYLAALGLELWLRGVVGRRLVVGLAVVLVGAPALAIVTSRTYGGEGLVGIGVPLGIASAGLLLLLLRWDPRRRGLAKGLLLGLTILDLGIYAAPRNPLVLLSRTVPPTRAEVEGRDLQGLDVIAKRDGAPVEARVIIAEGFGRGSYNHTMLRGLDGVSGYNGTSLLRFLDLMHLIEKGRFYPRTGLYRDEIALKPRRFDSPIIAMLGAPYVVSPSSLNIPRYRFIRRLYAKEQSEVLLRDRRAVPRAYLSTRTIVAESLAERERALLELDPHRATVVEDPALALDGPASITPVTVERLRPEHLVIECEAPAPALLVLTDSHYPGWRATVDGEEVPIAVVNHLFRGIAVGPGAHRVELTFRPLSYAIGWRVSVGTLFMLALGALWRRFGVRRRDGA